MAIAIYFFSDESEQLQGPYLTAADADRACVFYAKQCLEGVNLTDAEAIEHEAINSRRTDLKEQLGL